MSKNMLMLAGSFAVVAIISIVLVYFRSESMANPEVLAKRGLAVIKKENIIFFGLVMPAAVALISYFVYRKWFMAQPMNFLLLAVVIGIVLSIMGAVFYKKAFYEFTFFHIVHIVFYGWLMPLWLK